MQYKSCTIDDLDFLHSRIVGTLPTQPSLVSKEFRNFSIITAWNNQKDQINELRCERFAMDTKQKLTSFYSDDY